MAQKKTYNPRNGYILVAVMVVLIIVAHVFLWRSDMPTGEKLAWTAVNTLSWTIILAPVFLVGRWLKTIEAKNKAGD
ncbi:MAG: hypothetical protein AAF386_05855 [Pseudomonadota bacterium]